MTDKACYVKIAGQDRSSPTIDCTAMDPKVDIRRHRFPHSIVWTPIPMITWFFPFIGHMGIAYTNGVIRDFAGSYYVSEDEMGFGWPTRYLRLDLSKVSRNDNEAAAMWDSAVHDASDEYKQHFHNLFCDNCHSHVALALNTMKYDGTTSHNMFSLTWLVFFQAKHTGLYGLFVTWMPFSIVLTIVILLCTVLPSQMM